MGAGASVKQRSKSALTRELDRETEQKYKSITEAEELLAKRELEHAAIVDELRAEKNHAEANLAQVQETLERESKKWRKDKNEALHMMFSKEAWFNKTTKINRFFQVTYLSYNYPNRRRARHYRLECFLAAAIAYAKNFQP